MTFKGLTPIFWTDRMDASVQFYTGVLGFECLMQSPGFSTVHRDNCRIMLSSPNAHAPWTGPAFTGQVYIGLETAAQVDALWEAVKDRVEVIYAPDDFDYGAHEFGIRDVNGYGLSFGAPSVGTADPA